MCQRLSATWRRLSAWVAGGFCRMAEGFCRLARGLFEVAGDDCGVAAAVMAGMES